MREQDDRMYKQQNVNIKTMEVTANFDNLGWI